MFHFLRFFLDIIALLVVGVVMLLAFFAWQRYLELGAETGRRPPLVKLSMFTRANGKFAVTQCIAFLEWSAFLSWTFWAQVRQIILFASNTFYFLAFQVFF